MQFVIGIILALIFQVDAALVKRKLLANKYNATGTVDEVKQALDVHQNTDAEVSEKSEKKQLKNFLKRLIFVKKYRL